MVNQKGDRAGRRVLQHHNYDWQDVGVGSRRFLSSLADCNRSKIRYTKDWAPNRVAGWKTELAQRQFNLVLVIFAVSWSQVKYFLVYWIVAYENATQVVARSLVCLHVVAGHRAPGDASCSRKICEAVQSATYVRHLSPDRGNVGVKIIFVPKSQKNALVRMKHVQRAPGDPEIHVGEVVLNVKLLQSRCLSCHINLPIDNC